MNPWHLLQGQSLPQLLLIAAASTFLAVFLAALLRPSRYPSVKGPKGLPVLGNLPEFVSKGPLDCFTEWAQSYGGIFKCFLGIKEVLVVSDPDLVREVTVKRFKAFRHRPAPAEQGTDIFMGIVFARGQYWSTARNAVLPFFHSREHLESYLTAMTGTLDELASELEALPKGEAIDIHARLQRLTMDIFCRAAFGAPLGSDGDVHASDFARTVDAIFKSASVPTLTTLCSFFLLDWATRVLMNMRAAIPGTEEGVRKRRAAEQKRVGAMLMRSRMSGSMSQKDGSGQRQDVLSQLLNTQANAPKGQLALSTEQIAYLLGEFVLVGTDTTANLIAFAVFLLATHPDKLAKLHQEIQRLGKGYPPTSLQKLEEYTYTSMVVKETLRLYPTGNQMFREAAEETSVGTVRVPKGGVIMTMVAMLHRNSTNFPKPMSFLPERFDPTSPHSEGNNMGAYCPFGLGPRTCLGYKFALQEAALAIIHLHQNFNFEVVGDCKGLEGAEAIAAMKVETALVTKPANGIFVQVSPTSSTLNI